MFRNYVSVAVRNLMRYKVYSGINILGLTIGIACSALIFLFVRHELSYDRFHVKADRIYRVYLELLSPGEPNKYFATTAYQLAETLIGDYPAIEEAVHIRPTDSYVEQGDNRFYEDRVLLTTPAFFKVFSFPMLQGDPETALNDPNAIVITESTARKYFGNTSVLGKTMTVNDTIAVTVTAVLADVPRNSHFTFDILRPITPIRNLWWNHSYYTYILTTPSADPTALKGQLYDVTRNHIAESEDQFGFMQKHVLQSLKEIYLYSDLRGELGPTTSIDLLYLFEAIAVLILLIACINFMNLATARSAQRAREVGMRKVLGAYRGQLARQFLIESILITCISTVFAVGVIYLALPGFNQLAEQSLIFDLFNDITILLTLLGITVVVGLLSGSYPAMALSGFEPTIVLKGVMKTGTKGSLLRKILVVFQFAMSVMLMAATFVVYTQIDFMRNQTLGFDKEQIVVIPTRGIPDISQRYETVKEALMNEAVVLSASASAQVPGRGANNIVVLPEGSESTRTMRTIGVDHDFVETFGLELVAGRDLSKAFSTDAAEGFLLNEAALADLGWGTPEDAVGKQFEWGLGKKGLVIGIVKNFHYTSLVETVHPVVMHVIPGWFNYISVRTAPGEVSETIAALESAWNTLIPNRPFEFFFLDEDFDRQYHAYDRIGHIFSTFSGLAIVIACLGLFGLVSYTTELRTREIGVRKVLGGSLAGIVGLLSRDFLTLVIIANLIGGPVAYLLLSQMLQNFAYRIDIGAGTFILCAGLTLVIALITVGGQAVKAALRNPVESLRYE